MMIAYVPEAYAYETWCGDGQGNSALGEEAKASHLLTMKLAQLADREELEEHTHARPPSPYPSVGSGAPGTPEHPPSRSPSLSRSTGKPCHRSLSQSSSSCSDSSGPPQKPSHTNSELESKDDSETGSEAGTDMSNDSGDDKNEGSVGGDSQHGDSDSKSGSKARESSSESEGSGGGSGSCAHSTSTKSEDEEKKPPPMGKASTEADVDTSQTSLLPKIKRTNTEEEQRMSHQAFVCLMDEDFGIWWDQKIKDSLEQWSKQYVMTCDHTNPSKKAKSQDPLGTSIDYMESSGIFKLMKTSEFDLCHFYQVGSLGTFQSSQNPVSLPLATTCMAFWR